MKPTVLLITLLLTVNLTSAGAGEKETISQELCSNHEPHQGLSNSEKLKKAFENLRHCYCQEDGERNLSYVHASIQETLESIKHNNSKATIGDLDVNSLERFSGLKDQIVLNIQESHFGKNFQLEEQLKVNNYYQTIQNVIIDNLEKDRRYSLYATYH